MGGTRALAEAGWRALLVSTIVGTKGLATPSTFSHPSVAPGRCPVPGDSGCPLSSSMEMCDQRHNITMCPLCDKTCSYWKMSSACATARASHLFDNPATVFFSVFMALWGKLSARRPVSLGQRRL